MPVHVDAYVSLWQLSVRMLKRRFVFQYACSPLLDSEAPSNAIVGLKDIQNRNNPVVGDTSLVAFYFKLDISIQALTHTTATTPHTPV